MKGFSRVILFFLSISALAWFFLFGTRDPGSGVLSAAEKVPDGVQMLLKRGGIPAVFEPEFVSADEAKIDDEAWVLGVYANGQAKAYSLTLLNHHEVVNDDFNDQPLAAVW